MFAGVPTVEFDRVAGSARAEGQAASDRALFYQLLHIDEYGSVLSAARGRTIAQLDEAERSPSDLPEALAPLDYDKLDKCVEAIRVQSVARQGELSQSLRDVPRDRCIYLLKQYAPTALLDGCWLQNFSSAVTSHNRVAADLLKLYAYEIGDGDHSQHHGNAFRDLMHSLGVYLPDVSTVAFGEQRDVTDTAFGHPIFLLSISQFPRSFTPEILGLSLFYYVYGINPLYLALRDRLETLGASTRFLDIHRIGPSIEGHAAAILDTVKDYLGMVAEGSVEEANRHWLRIRRGFNAGYLASRRATDAGMLFIHSPDASPRERMRELITRIARYAKGYHSDAMMQGKSLDDWMNPVDLEPESFLDAFARSPWVSPGNAKSSYFFRKLVTFRGPMFRVFSPEELDVIAKWMDNLPRDDKPGRVGASERREPPPKNGPQRPDGKSIEQQANNAGTTGPESIERYSKMPLSQLYYYLLNIEDFPDVRPFAKHFAKQWLAQAGRELRRGERPLPFEPYRHEALDLWLDAQHTQQVESYVKNTDGPTQTREEIIESTIQLAPTTLIDGTWIQRAFNAGMSHTVVSSKLFHIYYDEVGNGDTSLNHPNVFRELLAQMDVKLPEFGTLEFSHCPLFYEESFRVPVFWLSVSQFPRSFLSEALGLNLAMELSGVGGTYRSAIDALKQHGFDPYFVELHNNIDNVSTGHTAWAISAIKYHLDEMFARGGAELVEEHWQRVWTGYRALAPQPLRRTGFQRLIPALWRH